LKLSRRGRGGFRWLPVVFIVFAAIGVSAVRATAEGATANPDSLATSWTLNLAVPDAPAFKVLDIEPSEILRPTSAQTVAIDVASAARSGVLPRSFAAEFAPVMLICGQKITLSDYRGSKATRFFARLRTSFASERSDDQSGQTAAGLGLRLTIQDNADPRTDGTYLTAVSAAMQPYHDMVARFVQRVPPTGTGQVDIDELLKGLSPADADSLTSVRNTCQDAIEKLRLSQKRQKWNAFVWDCGFAARYDSPDSLAKDIRVNKYQAWTGAGLPLGKSAQLVLGASASTDRTGVTDFGTKQASVGGRLYLGEQSIKGFLEGQAQGTKHAPPSRLADLGAEVNLGGSFWLEVTAGAQKISGGASTITSSLHLRWSLPDGSVARI